MSRRLKRYLDRRDESSTDQRRRIRATDQREKPMKVGILTNLKTREIGIPTDISVQTRLGRATGSGQAAMTASSTVGW